MIRLDDRLTPTRAPLTPPRLRAVARALRAGGCGLLRLSADERIAALDRVAASWLMPDSIWRRRALADLPLATGHAPTTIEIALANLWTALRAPHLSAVYEQERAQNPTRPLPGLALHVLAGNVPGVGIFGPCFGQEKTPWGKQYEYFFVSAPLLTKIYTSSTPLLTKNIHIKHITAHKKLYMSNTPLLTKIYIP